MYYEFNIGGTKIALGVSDKQCRLQWETRVPASHDSCGAFLGTVYNLVTEADQRFNIRDSIGIGIPGTPETEDGTLYTANASAASNKPLCTDPSARLGRDVRLGDDTNCFTLSEAWDDEFIQYPLVMGLILGAGIDGGLVLNGESITERSYITGKFGHIHLLVDALTLMDFGFPLRRCGYSQPGCIKSYLSGGGFVWLYRRYYYQPLDAHEIIVSWEQSDRYTLTYVERYLDLLAVCFGNILAIVDPDLMVINGSLPGFIAIMT